VCGGGTYSCLIPYTRTSQRVVIFLQQNPVLWYACEQPKVFVQKNRHRLLPYARAYSIMTHCEIHNLDHFAHTGCPRCIKGDPAPKSVSQQIEILDSEKRYNKQKEKEERWLTRGTLGELTEKYINQGDSEEDAFNYAKQELGL